MSYDFKIAHFDLNYTSNGGKLYHKHFPGNENTPSGLQAIHGKTGREAGVVLSEMLNNINNERVTMNSTGFIGEPKMEAEYNAENGWGSLVGQLIFIGQIAAACAQCPDEIVDFNA